MKTLATSLLLGIAPLNAAMTPVNFGFEDLSGTFPNGWSFSGSVSQAAGMGSPVAATLASGASLHQDFAPTTADGPRAFTLSLSLRLDGVGAIATNTARVRIRGNNNAGDLITLRLSAAGLECATNGTWATLAPSANQLGTVYQVTLVVGNLDGDADMEYRVTCDNGTMIITSAVQNVWHAASTTTNFPFETIRFESGAGNILTVDNLALNDSQPPAQIVANPGFEILPFPASWTATGGPVSVAGLNGTPTAARLPFNTSASITQAIA